MDGSRPVSEFLGESPFAETRGFHRCRYFRWITERKVDQDRQIASIEIGCVVVRFWRLAIWTIQVGTNRRYFDFDHVDVEQLRSKAKAQGLENNLCGHELRSAATRADHQVDRKGRRRKPRVTFLASQLLDHRMHRSRIGNYRKINGEVSRRPDQRYIILPSNDAS